MISCNSVTVRLLSLFFLLASVAFLNADESADSKPTDSNAVPGAVDRPVSYHTEIVPIFRTHCFGCHQNAKQLGEYRMTEFADLVRGGETGQAAIVPGDAEASYLYTQIVSHDGVAEMPKPPRKPLHRTEVELIGRWINQGAKNDSPEPQGPRYSADDPPHYAGPPTLPSLDVSPVDANLVAVAGYHELVLLNINDKSIDGKSIVRRLVGSSPRINSVRFSPDGKRVAAAGGTPGELGELQIWDAESGELLLSKYLTYDTLTGVSWSPDGKLVAIGANDKTVRGLDSTSGEQVFYQGAHEDWIRDTVFTNDGSHIVSVARDMSCKLTEVATERFIDNVTSITPGALSGGLSSVAIHPQRDEIIVGGADGVMKVYRVFRQTKRQIGDDANLVRNFPKMDGRIRQVAINAAGSHVAAAATIDGHSEVRVWRCDFTGELSDKMKGILGKRVADRSAEEKKLVLESGNSPIDQTLRFEVTNAAVYALDIFDDGAVVFAANDGKIRRLSPAGELVGEFSLFDALQTSSESSQSKHVSVAASDFDAAKWVDANSVDKANHSTGNAAPVSDEITAARKPVSFALTPERITLSSPYDYVQLVAVGTLADGSTIDVTQHLQFDESPNLRVQSGGLVRPVADGSGQWTVQVAGQKHTIPFEISGQSNFAVDFVRDVNPVLSRLGCNQGTCHGAQKGKNGFRLSLRGYDPIFDIRALTDDLAARRINPAAPQDSMMLRKPLGITPHEGGTLMSVGDPYHAVLRRWIADGSKLNLETPRVASIKISPENPVVDSVTDRQQVRVVATYTDASTRDVTREAFIESGNTEVATSMPGGVLQAVRRGEAPVLARFEGAYAATTLTVMGDRTGYQETEPETWNRIDELVAQKWKRMKIVPSELADEATFLRRVYLDLTGLPPSSDTVRAFLADPTPTRVKRAAIVDQLIGNQAYVEYWTNKWSDLLQVNRKFLGVEGSKKYRDWIRAAVQENVPYDEFARQILTASGSNNTNPPASYYKVLRTAEDTMENTTHLFLGIRFNCNKCHDHPFERWTQDQYYEMAAFFAKVDRKMDPESKGKKIGGTAVEGATPLYEIIDDTATSEILHARTGKDVMPAFPYELKSVQPAGDVTGHSTAESAAESVTSVERQPNQETLTSATDPATTRREQLADWMTDPGNPYFARSYVNRIWGYLTGVGLIEPIDDIRAGNPPTNPELLNYLTDEFIASGFNSRHIVRMIAHSRTYGLSVESNPLNEDDHQNYSHATPRRLPAEVIYDSVHALTGAISNIPGMPAGTRAAAATDSGVSLTDGFLANLGRPVRETACECERTTDLQLGPVMALISGPTIGSAISDPKNELEKIIAENSTAQAVAEEIFLRALGRMPTSIEVDAFVTMSGQLQSDHDQLVTRLNQAEADWKKEFEALESKRNSSLAEVKKQISDRQAEIADARAELEKTRLTAIADAEAKLAKTREGIPKMIDDWVTKLHGEANPEWFPIAPNAVAGSKDVALTVQPDRSILASGTAAKGTYTLDFETSLQGITGFRVEAIADPALPRGGPGLAGNFVVTEIAVHAGHDPQAKPNDLPLAKIVKGKADFLQSGFAIEPVFDGNAGNQNAWAVSPAITRDHWATFQFEKPIQSDSNAKTRLRFVISHNHSAANHLLGRFRISLTTHPSDIPLSATESLSIAASTPTKNRSETQTKLLSEYIESTDATIQAAVATVATGKQPVPPDELLTQLQTRQKQLEVVTPIDADLVLLRENVGRSQTQLKNNRLTAAEDLVWALVNSPAFLFNY
ncbi:DUF1549 domain-containing protein [Neorhodopirellula pilleata]|uniref:Planctomycete cytochrome C n=1 Tax=Neorhodopirellula pilleata TaxID=2714738 RepID=A0A5C5ZW55_9BACT|nr:DUF1549 domain-containing protein [Neorhodopirellula pilleata]TWT91380.1 Planctomycete cytochrome C [Neorhodopirellula pilleata]